MKAIRIVAPLLCGALLCAGWLAPLDAQAGGYFAFTVSGDNWLPVYGEGATEQEAKQNAIEACGNSDTCVNQVQTMATPACVAVADSPDWIGWAGRPDYQEAMAVALKECRDQGKYCQIISVECRQ